MPQIKGFHGSSFYAPRVPQRKHYKKYNSKIQQYKLIKKVLSQAAEQKFLLNSVTAAAISYTGASYGLSATFQGDNVDDRIGNKISLQTLQVSFSCTAADINNRMRVVIVQFTDGNVLPWPTFMSDSGSVNAPLSLVLPDQIRNVRFLYDSGPIDLTTVGSNYVVSRRIRIPIHKKKNALKTIQMEANTDTDGPGLVRMYVISDSAAASHPTFTYESRLDFTDM